MKITKTEADKVVKEHMTAVDVERKLEKLKAEFTLLTADGFNDKTSGKFTKPFGLCYDYNKDSNRAGSRVTGFALYTNVTNYAIIDVDLKKDGATKAKYREQFLDALKSFNVKIVQTRGDGLHIYCLWDESLSPKANRTQNIYYCNMDEEDDAVCDYAVDFFAPIEKNSGSIIVLPYSITLGKDGEYGQYVLIEKGDEKSGLTELSSVVEALEANDLIKFARVKSDPTAEERAWIEADNAKIKAAN